MAAEMQTRVALDGGGVNPVTVEVTRGEIVESRHRGSAVIVDLKGAIQGQWGDIDAPVYPRSAIKGLQALPLIETGAADDFGFSDAELALACASHGGEDEHARTALAMLEKLGLGEGDLECASHWPMHEETTRLMASRGEMPDQTRNNCSGKHAGMLAVAKALGQPTRGYIKPTHAVQQRILGVFEAMCGLDMGGAPMAVDGCSVPTWGMPLQNLAYGFARFAAPEDLADTRAEACRRIARAVMENPFYVAGTGRYCTEVMQALPNVFLKTGAEGVYIAALPEYGLGVALKCDDGATRAAEVMMTALLRHIGAITDVDLPKVERFLTVPLENRAKVHVGEIRPAAGFLNF